MKQEWEEILLLIPLSDKVTNTLTGSDTEIQPFIELVEAIEKLEVDRIASLAIELKIVSACTRHLLTTGQSLGKNARMKLNLNLQYFNFDWC